jgi:hypothetical protein
MYSYTVIVRFKNDDSDAISQRWIEWMTGKHLADVCAAGAERASLVRLDDCILPTFEARYLFASRSALDDYIANRAPELRAEGLRLFPMESGVEYQRTMGPVLASA